MENPPRHTIFTKNINIDIDASAGGNQQHK